MINRKIPWTSQPQYPVDIDRSNPLASRCLGVYLPANNNSRSGNPSRTVSSFGIGDTFLRTSSQHITIPLVRPVSLTGKGATLIGIVNSTNLGAAQCAFALTDGSSHFSVLFRGDQGGTPIAGATWNSPGSSFKQFAGPAYASGINYVVGFTTDTAGNFSVYVNGVLQSGSYSNLGTIPSVNLTKLEIAASNGTGDYLTGSVFFATAFEGALSASEIKALSDNPWQIFKSQSRRIWVGAAGGTNTAVNPGTGSIAITGYAPSIAQTANQAITPNVGNIVITGYAPTISQPQAVNPGAGTITITGYAPTVTQNVDVPVNPGVGTIAITGYAPTVAQTANQSVLPATGTIAITGYSPAVSQTANQAITPDVGTITVTGYAPTVQQAPASQNITPDVGTITITGYAPTVEQSSPLRLGGFEYSNKVYIKRNKKIYIFDSVEEADSYLEAEAKAEEIVQQSNKTSRLARKRAREKAFKSLAIEPVDTVDIPALKTLVSQLQTGFELPQLIAQQDWQRVVEIYNQAMEMQDEEDLLLIL